MSVSVSPITIVRGPQIVRFSDTFNRTSGALGSNWVLFVAPRTPIVDPINGPLCAIGAAADAVQACVWSTVGTSNPGLQWRGGIIALPTAGTLNGRNQFSQWLLVRHQENAAGANDMVAGPGVLLTSSGQFNGYYINIRKDKSWIVARVNNSTVTGIGIGGGAGSWANNDTAYLEAVINASDVTLTVKKNGTILETIVDNSVNRITVGAPGFVMASLDNTAGQTYISQWRNFECGPV